MISRGQVDASAKRVPCPTGEPFVQSYVPFVALKVSDHYIS